MDPTQNITYGLGEVNGTVSMDTVTFGGFTVPSQEFRACISVTWLDSNLTLLFSASRSY